VAQGAERAEELTMAQQTPAGYEGDDEMISGINVTPLVDITLVLLIIFMVTATYIVREAIEVDLPRAAHAGEATGATLAVVVTKDGSIYLDGVRRSEQELRARTREAVNRDRDARAIISADKASLHGAVIHVIDLVKGEGVSRFAINIAKEQ
jgi:biopolymer transport protein TolR